MGFLNRQGRAATLVSMCLCVAVCRGDAQTAKSGKTSNGGQDTTAGKTTQGQGTPSGGGSANTIQSYALAYNGLRGDAMKISAQILASLRPDGVPDPNNASKAPATNSANGPTKVDPKIIVLDKSTMDDLTALQLAKLETDVLYNQYLLDYQSGARSCSCGSRSAQRDQQS